jgi:hypothetical protein
MHLAALGAGKTREDDGAFDVSAHPASLADEKVNVPRK